MLIDALQIHPMDNVAVALRAFAAGELATVGGAEIEMRDAVPAGHKFALQTIPQGGVVRKYGQPIGVATESIAAGGWVHAHNLAAGGLTREYERGTHAPPPPAPLEGQTFQGYRRADGRVGTRNYVAIISSVNCSASVSKWAARRFENVARDYPQIDGVLPLTHAGGCGMQFAGMQHQLLNRVLGGMARHPNIAAYLLVGLGCEQGSVGYLLDDQRLVQIDGLGGAAAGRPRVLSMQDLGGTQATIDEAARQIAALLPAANAARRETTPAAELILGTKCGGSDGASGITANPAIGVASDLLIAAGGTAILAETTEIYGAEQLLTRRAKTPEVADKLLARLRWWEQYTRFFGAELDNNPSVGNKAGGLTTIYEKSLGAIAKAGSTALNEVYQYAEPVAAKGLVVMDTPGFDPVSVTGMVAGGANVVAFSTGRGSCYGCKPTPSIKIATNSRVFEQLPDDIDFNAGVILEGVPLEAVGQALFQEILAVASGKKTKSEQHGFGDEEFIPWQIGPVL